MLRQRLRQYFAVLQSSYVFWALASGCPGILLAGEAPLEKVRVAYSAISGNQAPAWVAYEKGFFRKNGLDVEMVFIEGGAKATQALISGDIAFSTSAGSSVIQSSLQGQDVVMIASFLNTFDYQLMVHNSITRPDQLKGKTLAVSRFGSSSDFATRYALDKYGLVPDKDVTILEIGSQPARFAALEAGKVQGAMVAIPLTLKAKKIGFHSLADLQMLGLEYQQTSLATTGSLINSKPQVVRNALTAFVEAIHYFKTQRGDALAILQKYLKGNEPDAIEETYEAVGLGLIPEKPYPTLRGIQIMLQEMGAKDPKARTARPEQFVDTRFLKELDSSGFIDRLYKSKPVVASVKADRPSPGTVVAKEKAAPGTVVAKEKAAVASKPAAPAPGTFVLPQEYTVKAGDTLSLLALRFYGSTDKWRKIHEANAKALVNANSLFIGQKLHIPADDAPGR